MYESVFTTMAGRRPIFHSEADLQHAYAWDLHRNQPSAKVRLERPCHGEKGQLYIDVWMDDGAYVMGIELKYKTKRFQQEVFGEDFRLKDQRAQDIARYDFLRDIMRIEGLIQAKKIHRGVAILLTNDPSYWSDTGRRNRVDEQFRIHEGRVVRGTLVWGVNASPGTTHRRDDPITLLGAYEMRWREYASVGDERFRYLFLPIESP